MAGCPAEDDGGDREVWGGWLGVTFPGRTGGRAGRSAVGAEEEEELRHEG